MSIFQRGSTYWYEFVFNGQRIRESTGSASYTLAVKAERKRHSDLEHSANGVQRRKRPVLFPVAAREWMEESRARWSEANISIHTYNIKHLSESFGRLLLADITPALIGKYQRKRQQQGASNRLINMEVGTLRMIMKKYKLWTAIADEVKMLPERRDIGKALSADEEKRLLDACRKSPQPSLYTAVVIYCNTGLRSAELRRARWHQVDFLGGWFQVGAAKTEGSAGRLVPLNQGALAALQEWRLRWPNAKPEDYIFPTEKLVYKGKGTVERKAMTAYGTDPDTPLGSWKRAWTSAKKAAGVECRIHDLRHHFISRLAQTQTPDATIQSISGHLSRRMLEHYSHVRLEAKRAAVGLLDSPSGNAVQ